MAAGRFAAALLLLLGLLGCAKSSKPWIDRLEVDAFEGGDIISLSKDQLEARLVKKLEAARFVVARPGQKLPDDVKPWRVELAAGLGEPDLEHHTSAVILALEVQQRGGAAEPLSIDSQQLVTAPATNDVEAMQNAIRDALDDALERAAKEAAAVIELEPATDDALVEKLSPKGQPTSNAALRLLVRRHHKAALQPLLERLKSDDLHELRGVIGLLVELGAPEAVNPLVDAARQKGPVFQREIVFAVGAIGGDDAEAYLDLVASGHDDPLIRASAEQALKELREKKNRPPRGEPK